MDSTSIGSFLRENALAIILVSIIFSFITIYITVKEIKFPKRRYIRKKTIMIE